MSEVKYIDATEFREKGYLFEVNRQFLHPLGLALVTKFDEEGNESIGGIWDYRDDPEGMLYGESLMNSQAAKDKAQYINEKWEEKSKYREEKYGFTVQPLGDNKK